jgi:hypothetical protein
MADMSALNLVFARNENSPDLTFVEAEDQDGQSIRIGEWGPHHSADPNLTVLRLGGPVDVDELSERVEAQLLDELHQHQCACGDWPTNCPNAKSISQASFGSESTIAALVTLGALTARTSTTKPASR